MANRRPAGLIAYLFVAHLHDTVAKRALNFLRLNSMAADVLDVRCIPIEFPIAFCSQG
jgi:hypothetical protein